ncbi:hypothetical protein E2320_000196 [Naja naja]|nr:hypothetical protein E2320_000196 [Naja naja]
MNTTTQVIANFSNDGVKNGKEEGEKDDNADSDTSDEEIEGESRGPFEYPQPYYTSYQRERSDYGQRYQVRHPSSQRHNVNPRRENHQAQ